MPPFSSEGRQVEYCTRPKLAAGLLHMPSLLALAAALSQARPGDMSADPSPAGTSLLPADRARTQWAAASDVLDTLGSSGRRYAWQLDATAPRLVLPPKVGTTAMIQFVNDCAGGRIAPTQLICNQDECDQHSEGLGVGRRGAVGHLHCASSGSAAFPQPHEYVYGVMRHPVERLVSFFNYRLNASSPRDDWLAAGLPFESSTTIEAVIDAATNATLTGGFHPLDSLHEYLDASGHTKILCSVDEHGRRGRRRVPSEPPRA